MTAFNIWMGLTIGLYFAIGYLLLMIFFDEKDREDSFLIYMIALFWFPIIICKILGTITDKIRKKVCG